MCEELGPVWQHTWSEIWTPLFRHAEFGDDLARDLFREHVKRPQLPAPATEVAEEELKAF